MQWDRDRYLSSLGLPGTADPFLERLTEHLKAALAALEEAREAGRATIGTDRTLHLSALAALPIDGIPKRTWDLIFSEIGTAQFADMIMEMDAHTGFSEVLLACKARDTNELVSLYAAVIAHGTDLDARSVAAMIPKLDPVHVSTAMRLLEMPGRLSRANDRVVEFQRTHPITELWGSGRLASSDSTSLDTSPHLFYARVDPRRRTHAVGMYTHVLDQHGIVYNQPIVLNERQAGVAIEGVICHNENRDDGGLRRLSVDTHGYTNVGMTVSKLLGFDLCAVTGAYTLRVLVASHAKPWTDSTDVEKLDPSHGLLLAGTLDKVYDGYLMSVHPETGELLFSDAIDEAERARLAGDHACMR